MRKSTPKDLDGIMEIIKAIVKEMNSYGNYQWNESYPSPDDFTDDMEKGNLYVEELDGKIASFICLNCVEAPEYKELEWSIDQKALVVHRMGVNPNFRGRGLAKKLMEFADELAVAKDLNYIRVDTSSQNAKMNSLITKCGFKYIGTVQFAGVDGDFCCYDKLI
ncbi:L-amino acid N-acyltransferase YncA [Peptoclostridium litorale DSM 5388]|uniref:Acetyltransferase family protein n=1 Tax=Peptoclostridium litorale DSM 5388 TaxID=1121324 RepID=A0A069RR35_PEPLI|nr:GNAT family N-acetyltransferase [Peptoclostridium litorale]KDR96617.1 acetyltransferase family protein [Peptoclostridium litorale DSM 5388]SIN68414.1 L-amino acid N-acyltransferase YncA [Peptoclostridium litorale DSM 5388]